MVAPDVYAFALLTAAGWGFSPVLIKRGMANGGSTIQATVAVISVGAALFWLSLLTTGGAAALGDVDARGLVIFATAGVVGTDLGRITVFTGIHRVGASVNSAALNARPLFATGIALVWLGEPVGIVTGLGVVVLVAGLVTLTASRGGNLGGWGPRDLLLPLAAAMLFAIGNVIRRFGLTTTDLSVLQAVTLNESAALVAIVAFVVASGRRAEAFTATWAPVRFFVGAGLFSAIGLLSLFEAFDRGPVAVVDPLAGTAPLFTVVFAAVLLGDLERVTKGVVGGAALVVVGAGLITVAS